MAMTLDENLEDENFDSHTGLKKDKWKPLGYLPGVTDLNK